MTTFDDGKEDGALRTIGEVGQALGLKPHVLRYWEEQFPMLQPLKRSGGRRYYRPEDVALVETIDRLVNREGYTLKGARQAIEEGKAVLGEPATASAPEAEVAEEHAPQAPVLETSAVKPGESAPVAAEIIAELKGIRERLAAAVGA
ncbi:MerR family transcriptional regulator [Erythrobacter sp. SDW2]|uniref:MerR family transcriptional regulator n=1 Tax=Erythrobacter sp. SDW2 TaxID=2907154 RepID=UPI001F392DB2|nr:MerR family transcriptional regulator [Erythrobacter sp. SDW2]UIP07984.1 MerR family transcriptional regulator [Erythrobacter sp. SDW2]